jgi:pyruvate,water dikinase
MHEPDSLVVPLATVGLDMVAVVGGKNASLGEMIRDLRHQGVPVPDGFATTARAYRDFIATNGLAAPLKALLGELDITDLTALQQAGQRARALVRTAPLPPLLCQAIGTAYGAMGSPAVAVRSSATAEDLPEASFAGQQDTYLHIEGDAALLEACRRCFASLFNDRAICYRQRLGFDHLQVALSIGVQRMVRSDLACAGVMFSLDTESGFRDAVLLTAAYGLGESVVQGAVNPDELLIFKPTLAQGFAPIISRRLGSKATRLVYGDGAAGDDRSGRPLREEAVPQQLRDCFALSDSEALQLARWACQIERRAPGQAHADGHRMGQGRRKRPTVHSSGQAGNGALPTV